MDVSGMRDEWICVLKSQINALLRFFQYRILRFTRYIWNYHGNSLRIRGRRLVGILLVKLPSGLQVAKSSKSDVRIIDIGVISWKFSWLRMGEKLHLIAQSTLNWRSREISLKSTHVDQMLTKCWTNVDLLLIFHFQNIS